MKKIKIYLLFIMSVILCSCSENQYSSYVKYIVVGKNGENYNLSLVYYDFSNNQENYLTTSYVSNDIYTIGIEAMADRNYNFRLCECCFLSADIFVDDISKAINLVNSLKLPVSSNIVCLLQSELALDNYTERPLSAVPLYKISTEDNLVTGRFPVIKADGSNLGAILVRAGKTAKILDNEQWSLLNILANSVDEVNMVFRNGELYAELKNISTSYMIKDNVLNVVIDMTLKDYKGVSDRIGSKNVFVQLLKMETAQIAQELYDDIVVNSVYNLKWYCTQQGIDVEKINIIVNIY